jgi:hypothetical protein
LSRTFLDVNFGVVGLEIAMHDEPDVGLVLVQFALLMML